jgi:hypothetical protein
MVKFELYEYEANYLVANLRDAMHMHERMAVCQDETLRVYHERMRSQCVRLLEAIQPKHNNCIMTTHEAMMLN